MGQSYGTLKEDFVLFFEGKKILFSSSLFRERGRHMLSFGSTMSSQPSAQINTKSSAHNQNQWLACLLQVLTVPRKNIVQYIP
jgi:hypothetical protein